MAFGFDVSTKPLGTGGRIFGTLFFAVFFLMGLGFEVLVIRHTVTIFATYNWARAEAVILSSEVLPPRDNEHNPVLRVRYAYSFKGARQESDQIETGSGPLETSDAYQLANQYVNGRKVPCWVNPSNPGEAVLQRNNPAFGLVALFPLIFVAVGGIGIWSMWRRKALQGDDPARPISSRAANSTPGQFPRAAFFSFFLVAGCGATYAIFIVPLSSIVAARAWAPVPCEVVASRVKTHSDSDGDTYSVDVVYRYTYQNHTYTANRYQFAESSSSGYASKAAIVRQLPAGLKTTCFVDPAKPTASVLERNATGALWFGLLPLTFVAVGAGGLFFTFRRKTTGTGSFATPLSAWSQKSSNAQPLAPGSGVGFGSQALKPATARRTKVIAVTLAAVFWNGIVSVFIFSVGAGKWGDISWFITLFLIPFVAVGLGLIGGVFYQAMALFNPSPHLTLSRGVLLPGITVDVSWEMAGRTDRLRRLQISLEGREEATYRRGTDTRTDKEIFSRIQIIDTMDPIAMRGSSARLQLPTDAMPSFKSANNKIVWVLNVHGEVPRWPDIKDEFPLEIAPHPVTR